MGVQVSAEQFATEATATARPSEGREPSVGLLDRFAGALVGGIVAGLGMFVVLATVAISQGRGVMYPAYAVQAMLSGRRVLPDHPVATLAGRRAGDLVIAPLMFLLPAVLVAVLVTWWVGRRAGLPRPVPRATVIALPAALLATVLFLLLVVLLGFREAEPAVQRVSSGYGVRQLGLAAWLVGHAVYVVVLSAVLGPAMRAVASARRGNRPAVALRGERTRSA